MSASSVFDLIIGIEIVVSLGMMFVFAALAAYYSFAIGLATKDPMYRRRAAWTGFLAIGLSALVLSAFVFGGTPTQTPIETQGLFFLNFIILAVWIDSAIRTATEEDFFHRNTLYWSIIRYPFLVFLGILTPLLIVLPQNVFPQNSPNWLSSILLVFFVLSLAFTMIGVITLLVSGTRTKNKSTRNYLRWLGFAVLSLVIQFAIPLSFPFSFHAAIPLAIMAFCLFKMARSLTPLRKLNEQNSDAKKPIPS